MKTWISTIGAGLVCLLAVGLPGAHAGTGLYTAGDARAMLNSYPRSEDVFSRESPRASLDIRPFPDDLPYCVGEWHVLALAWWEAEYSVPARGIVHTKKDVFASLTALEAHFFLDGVLIDVVRTSIDQVDKNIVERERDFVEEELEQQYFAEATAGKVWGFQWGRILAPGELPVGMHTFAVLVRSSTDPNTFFESDHTFEVSPLNSPACTV